jgi:hypothetical protein
MKIRTCFIILLIAVCELQIYSQEEKTNSKEVNNAGAKQDDMKTLFGSKDKKIAHGGWGGFTLGYTRVGGKDAFLSGGRGGWLIDHHFTLGLAGYGFVTNMYESNITQPTINNYSLAGGYGGLLLEPIIAPFNPVHISIPIIIGAGGASVLDNQGYHGYDHHGSASACFVLESGIDMELNIVKFFRIALNVSYRFATNISAAYYSIDGTKQFDVPTDAMRGFNAGMTMKFGKF